jgi:oligopeptide/dipeptide ABC transporter ATP-binding protein
VEELETIPGTVPNPADLPVGCSFAPRCPYASELCLTEEPPLIDNHDGKVRCWMYSQKWDERSEKEVACDVLA